MNSDITPSPNGRCNETGRFEKGCRGGPGNPHARAVGQFRSAMIEAIPPGEITVIVRKLVDMAVGGDLHAIREVLDRTVGKAGKVDLFKNSVVNVDMRQNSVPLDQLPPITEENFEERKALLLARLQKMTETQAAKEGK